MSDYAARSVLSRINLREMAVAAHYEGLASDLQLLAMANQKQAEDDFMSRRTELVAAYGMSQVEQQKPFAFSNGVAVIPIHGTLINRFSYSWGYVTGYNFVRQQTALAGQDPDVTAIVYDVNTYGGEAAGCFECSADIKRLANGKPTMAVVDSNAYSAGMALAVGADKIVVTPSGGVGSVGVVATHVSYEQMLEKAGIKVTFIHAGAHKVDGNPYQDLSADVKADIQKSIDVSYDAFVALVAKGRNMDEKAVRATEARTYRAEEAMSLGLIDAVATPQEAMQALMGELSGSNPQPKKEDAMSNAAKEPGAENKATPEQLAQATTDAKKAERERVSGIQSCEEAKGRESLASHLAFSTEMSVDDAKKLLAAAPKGTESAASANPFKSAMESTSNPNVGAEGASNGSNAESPSNFILAAARAAGVRGFAQQSKS